LSIAFRPGVEIETRFAVSSSTDLAEFSAFIIGPNARTIRYDVDSEREGGYLGIYDADGSVSDPLWSFYGYPGKLTGDTVDLAFVKLFVKNGLLKYWEATSNLSAPSVNTLASSSVNFIDNPLGGYPMDAALGDRGVKVGDRINVTGSSSISGAFNIGTYVTGFSAAQSASSIAAAAAGIGNKSTGVLSTSATAGATNVGTATATATGTAYEGRAVGRMTETYRVEVTRGSTGGDHTTALLRITSASGTDDVASKVPSAAASATDVGSRGLTITLAAGSLVAGDFWTVTVTQAYTIPSAITVTGTYNATDEIDRTYLVEVVTGATTVVGAKLRVSEINGKDISKTYTLTLGAANTNVPVALGTYGPTLAITAAQGFVAGDSWTIAASAAKPTNYRTLKLAHALPTGTLTSLTAKLYIVGDYEIPVKSTVSGDWHFVAEASQLKVGAGVMLYDDEWTVAGDPVALPLVADSSLSGTSKIYASLRYWTQKQTALNSVNNTGDLDTLLSGPSDTDNPLKAALVDALRGAAGRDVYFFAVGDPNDLDNWSSAFTAAERTRAAYGIVVLSDNSQVTSAALSFASSSSSPMRNMDKVAWITCPAIDNVVVCNAANSSNEANLLATIVDDAGLTGTQYTYVSATSGNALFSTLGVRANDELRVNFSTDAWGDETYDAYKVSSVINETTLLLQSGPSVPLGVARRIEIWRTPNVADKVAIRREQAIPYQDYLARFIPVSSVVRNGKTVGAYFLAAFLAGLRSRFAPHQPLTRYPISGFSAIPELDGLSEAHLNDLAEVGSFLVAKDPLSSVLTVRHGITAGDYNDVNIREESIISNVHSIKFALFDILNPYVGRANLTETTIALIRTDILGLAQRLRSSYIEDPVGAQVINLEIIQVRQSPLAKDTLLIDVAVVLPAPVNRIRLTLYVS
jgi:hypothetical protein